MLGWKKTVRQRLINLFYLTLLLFIALSYRLVSLQAFQQDKYRVKADDQHKGTISLPALRGSILDRKYVVLANSLALSSIAADPTKIRNRSDAAEKIAKVLKCDPEIINNKLSIASTFAWIERKIDDETAKQISDLKIDGIFLLKESTGKRFYPKGNLGVHILGCTGIDDQGLDGVESTMETYLKGKPGEMSAEMDRDGRIIPGGLSSMVPAVQGYSVVLTIDESIQYIVENYLDAYVKKFGAESGSVLVMDAKTGGILAMSTKPDIKSTDPKSPQYMQVTRNACVADAYEPGSTFKVLLAAAALDSGKVTLTDKITCGNTIDVGGWTLHNANDGFGGNPTETITDIIAYSFNTGSVAIGLRMGCKTYYDYLAKFGMGEISGIELPGEADGLLLPLKEWTDINLATIAFGQGVAITPIQLVSAVQGVVNNGDMMQPHIVKQIIDSEGNVVHDFKPKVKRKIISSETSYKMTAILRNVVENGTGGKAKVPGYLVGGKTGTANLVENGVYAQGKYIASFVGFVPAEDPKFIMLVKIKNPKGVIWGGSVAAPIFADIAKESLWRLGVPPSFPNEINAIAGNPPKE